MEMSRQHNITTSQRPYLLAALCQPDSLICFGSIASICFILHMSLMIFPYALAKLPWVPSGLVWLISRTNMSHRKYSVSGRENERHWIAELRKHVLPRLYRPQSPPLLAPLFSGGARAKCLRNASARARPACAA
jgi:hypothetical protein